MTSRNGSAIVWASFNHPTSISNGSELVQFSYNQNQQRWSSVYSGSAGIETTYFVGNLLEKVISAGTVDYRHYIYAGPTRVAIYSRQESGANSIHYVREDHLGSAAAILNADGTAYVKESFTAYGVRRSSCTWDGAPTAGNQALINAVSRRGYTFETALGAMGLNDLNGRIEDAVTGRFLSPDPTIPRAGGTQSYNRYSYVENRPLTFIDPTGYEPSVPLINDGAGGGDYISEVSITGTPSLAESVDRYLTQQLSSLSNAINYAPSVFDSSEVNDTITVVGKPAKATSGKGKASTPQSSLSWAVFNFGVRPVFGFIDCALQKCSPWELLNRFAGPAKMVAPGFAAGKILAAAGTLAIIGTDAAEAVPLGFANAAQFEQACAELCSALSESGISDFTIGVRGSSITGTSFSGAPFSAASDIDFFVAGPQMTAFPINSYGLVYPSTLNAAFPAIGEWSSNWSSILGRGVSVGGFASVPEGSVLLVH